MRGCDRKQAVNDCSSVKIVVLASRAISVINQIELYVGTSSHLRGGRLACGSKNIAVVKHRLDSSSYNALRYYELNYVMRNSAH
jgi:hypothetical protein